MMRTKYSPIQIKKDSVRGYRLCTEMDVKLPRTEVFDFFSDAMQLERITPPWVKFSVVTPQPIEMRSGLLLDYRLKIHSIPIGWRTEIREWAPPEKFIDIQLKGPYRQWHHEHLFEDLGNGWTRVKDQVHYIPRGGSLIHRFMVKPDLVKIFTFRQDRLTEIFNERIENRASASNPPNRQPGLVAVHSTGTTRELNS
ncbi:MAG: ligand-binding SRPBCC domain-containing protein [Mariniblastus sp.]|jgi:ligand-binding SRPBCC domain-containing protein